MNSSIIKILEILNIARSLSSVGFSVGYNFELSQSDDFFHELSSSLKISSPIFAGIIILETSDANGNFLVVDGIQRITTLSLLLCALCEAYKNTSSKNDDARLKIFSRYLINDENEVKTCLVGKDKEIYKKIVFSQELTEEETQSKLFQAYNNFLLKIKNREISATNLFKAVSKVQFMVIFSDKLDIPARELYQSLNGSRNDLSQINLITSFICQHNESVADEWQAVINTYINLGFANFLNGFMRDFLAVQNNGKVPSENNLYRNFKSYYNSISEFQSIQSIIKNLCKYAMFYLKFLQADFEDEEIKAQVVLINENNGYDSYPYLMEVLDDLENSHISRPIFLNILEMINSFIVDRDSNGESNMNFASLSSELNKMLAMKQFEPNVADENKITINEINHLATFEV